MNDYQIVDDDDRVEQTIFICTNDRKRNEQIFDDVMKKINEVNSIEFCHLNVFSFSVKFFAMFSFFFINRSKIFQRISFESFLLSPWTISTSKIKSRKFSIIFKVRLDDFVFFCPSSIFVSFRFVLFRNEHCVSKLF